MVNYLRMNTLFRKKEGFNPAESGLAFTIAVLLPYLVLLVVTLVFRAAGGDTASALYIYLSSFSSQLSYLAVLLFLAKQKGGIKPFCAGKFSPVFLPVALMLSYGMLFGLGYLNELFIGLLADAGLSYNPVSVPLDGAGQLALSLIAVGVLPAFCEELLFRGAILRGTDYMKTWQVALVNGLAFSLFHQNPAQTVYPLITGAVFALVALRSGSAWPCVLMHAVNNVVILLIGCFAPEAELYNAATISTALVCFALAAAYLIFFAKTPARGGENEAVPIAGKYFFCFAAPGAVMCAFSWIVALVG